MNKFTDTGLSIIEDIRTEPEYAKIEKEKELFTVEIPPLEYLKMCKLGFNEYGKYDSPTFKPSDGSLEKILEYYTNVDKMVNMPYLEETYKNNYENENEYYFTQEGRHRALVAHQLGYKSIPVTYVRTLGLQSKIGMEKYVKQPKLKDIEMNIKQYKNSSIKIIKSLNIPIFDFNLGIKRYRNGQLAGFDVNSFNDGDAVSFYLNYYIDKIMIEQRTVSISEDIIVDSILHEYGHLIFNILLESESTDNIKDFYSKKYSNDSDFKNRYINYIKNSEMILDELTEEDLEYFDEQYWDYFLEEEFAENFMKYIRLKNNNLEYFQTVQPLKSLKLSKAEILFFDKTIGDNKKVFNEFKKSDTYENTEHINKI